MARDVRRCGNVYVEAFDDVTRSVQGIQRQYLSSPGHSMKQIPYRKQPCNDKNKHCTEQMTRKHCQERWNSCFVSTALQSVGRWRRRRSLDSISKIIHSRIQLAAPFVFLVTWHTTFALSIFKPIFTEIHRAREAKGSFVNFNAALSVNARSKKYHRVSLL